MWEAIGKTWESIFYIASAVSNTAKAIDNVAQAGEMHSRKFLQDAKAELEEVKGK